MSLYIYIFKKKRSERKDHETRQDMVNDTLMDTLGVKTD